MPRRRARDAAPEPARAELDLFGVRLRLLADDPALLGLVRSALPRAARTAARGGGPSATWALRGAGPKTVLLRDGRPRARASRPEALLARLQAELGQHVASVAPEHVLIPAGVVAWQDRAIVLTGAGPGPTRALVAALARAGATPVSETYAVLDLGGRVLGYAPGPAPAGARQPLRLGAVVRTCLVRGAPWQPAVASRAEGARMLIDDAAGVARAPVRVLATVGAATERAVALVGPHGDADVAACALLAALSDA